MTETKKVKRKKLNFKKLFILLLFLYLIGYSFYYVLKMPIKNIYIEGNTYISSSEIIKIANLEKYPPIFKVNSKKIVKKLKKLTLVNNVKIKKNLNGKISLFIEENKPLLYNNNNDTYIYQNGVEEKSDIKYNGIPILINYVTEDIFKDFIKNSKKINYDIFQLISEVEYSPSLSKENKIIDETRFLFRMNDNNTVYINIKNLDNLNYYKESITPFDYNGILYLDTSNDENFVFSKY